MRSLRNVRTSNRELRGQVVQDVAEAARLLALDLDRQEIVVRPGKDDRALGRQLAAESEVGVIGQLVDDRVAGEQPARLLAELALVAVEDGADDLVR
jgi:hypothetical protein